MSRPSSNKDDDLHESVLPVVPFVPYRCPSCQRHHVKTSNTRGRLRQHVCLACGMRYRSFEVDASSVTAWNYTAPPDAQ